MQRLTQDVQRSLAMLILLNGLKTDPSQPGVEKMVITEVNDKWLVENRMRISSSDLEFAGGDKQLGDMLSPQVVFAVKGWNRSICAIAVLMAIYEMPQMLEACCFLTNRCIKFKKKLSTRSFVNLFRAIFAFSQDIPDWTKKQLPQFIRVHQLNPKKAELLQPAASVSDDPDHWCRQ
eukprot:s3343_g10.t1